MSAYFDMAEGVYVKSVEELLALNIPRTFYRIGDTAHVDTVLHPAVSIHTTAGIFRGQLQNWPLIPHCFRGLEIPKKNLEESALIWRYGRATRDFEKFCKRASVQNPGFPEKMADRMSIAQHFGVRTPLLDWSRNIFTAIFFAVRSIHKTIGEEERMFIYHIEDERHLQVPMHAEGNLAAFAHSAFVEPFRIDRRIERQQGVFTFHPDPARRPPKVPIRVYVIGIPLAITLIRMMRGFGFTEDYYFPDYAGIATAVNSDNSLD